MSLSLLPDVVLNGITDVLPDKLKERDICLLMMDFDNTIVPYTTSVPTQKVLDWLEMMRLSGIRMCVVSNSKKDRVKIFCDQYDLQCITHAGKPSKKGILRCLEKYGVDPKNAALVGDQIYTDTLGGNRAGVTTILIPAIHNHNIWLKLRHVLEYPFIILARNRRDL